MKEMIMSTATLPTPAPLPLEARRPRSGSLLHRAFAALVESRRVSAQRRMAIYLADLTEEQLAALGLSSTDIALIKAHRWPS